MARNNLNKRKARITYKIVKAMKKSNIDHRLKVNKTNLNIYAQIIELSTGKILAESSTISLKDSKMNVESAKVVGKNVAEKAKKLKIEKVVFDRGGYLYHGRVKALAESARENGLKF
jgi:large subunit ribosomal protein L18